MNLWAAGLVIVVVSGAAIALLLLIRRRTPPGGLFADITRAVGVFGVLGTTFAVLLAFVIFLAFESYGTAKRDAGQEAVAITQLYSTAALFPAPVRNELRGELVCYARAVVGDEWDRMRDRAESDRVQGWVGTLEATIAAIEPRGEREKTGYDRWFAVNAQRQEGRRGRLAEAAPFVPGPLWLVLLLGATLVVGYLLFLADPREPRRAQAVMIGTVTAIIVSGLLMVRFLDHPYQDRSGSIRPTQMERTLELMERGRPVLTPCDRDGAGRPS